MRVWEAVVPAGEVVGVRLIRRKRDRGDCRGYGARTLQGQAWGGEACLLLLQPAL